MSEIIGHKNMAKSSALKYFPYIFLGYYAKIGLIFAHFVKVISILLK